VRKSERKKLPDGWRWASLADDDLVEIIMGQSPPGETYNTERIGLPFFQGKADFGRIYPEPTVWCSSPKRIAEPNDILLSVRAPVGPTNLVKEKCCIGRGVSAIRCKDGLSYKYLFMILRNFEKHISSSGSGSIFDAIGKDEIKKTEFPLPSTIEEQITIANQLEDKMTEIEKMRQAMLKQKEAVDVVQEAILREVFPYRESHELPIGWKFEYFGNLFWEDRQQIDSSNPLFSALSFIGLENIESNTRQFIKSENETGESTCFLFDESHVLYGKLRPYLNKVYLPEKPGRCSMEIIPLRPRNDYYRELIAALLQTRVVIDCAVKYSTGGRMPRARIEKIKKLRLPLPSIINLQSLMTDKIERQIEEINKIRVAANNQIGAIEALPAAILRKVFDFEDRGNGAQ